MVFRNSTLFVFHVYYKNFQRFVTGYGFVDFESPACAEGAVKGLLSKGIQAQMAKVGIWMLHRPAIVRLFCMQVILTPRLYPFSQDNPPTR